MQFTSTDIAEVESTWQQFVPSSSLQNADPRRFRFDWHSEDLGSVTMVDYRLAAQIHSRAEPEEQLLVCRVDAADARVWSARDTIDAGAPWISGGARVEARWERSARVRAFVIDRPVAERRVAQLTGVDELPLRVTGLAPHSAVDARRWEKTFDYIDAVIGTEPVEPLLVAELERHVLMMTLASFPTTVSEALHRPVQRSGAPASVRRALAYIDENAHRAITIEDVAAASYISTRGLQYAFRRALDITPAEALRRARLEGARSDLQIGNGRSVAEIARRWGFSNSSRFAAAYREAYATPPSLPAP